MRNSSSQWSFANNSAAAYSQFLSFKSRHEQGGSHNTFLSGFSQKSLGLDKLGGSQHIVHPHPWQPKDVHITSQTNHLNPSIITSSVLSSHLTTPNSPNVITTAIGAPPISTAPPPSNGPVVGSTDLKNAPSISVGPCQLTLFYNGSVCVYDNVSPEKAQAIMLLAGNGDSNSSTSSAFTSQTCIPKVQPPVPRTAVKDTAILNHSPGFSSPISLPVIPKPVISHSAVPSSTAVEVNPIKPVIALSPASVISPEPPKSTAPIGASGVKSIPSGISSGSQSEVYGAKASLLPTGTSGVKSSQSAVPQARKASLARFLEKRKIRVTAAAPYTVNENGSECNTIGGAGSTFFVNSASSNPLPASN